MYKKVIYYLTGFNPRFLPSLIINWYASSKSFLMRPSNIASLISALISAGLTHSNRFQFLGYKESNGEMIGPYGLGASLFSLFLPLSLGLAFGLVFALALAAAFTLVLGRVLILALSAAGRVLRFVPALALFVVVVSPAASSSSTSASSM